MVGAVPQDMEPTDQRAEVFHRVVSPDPAEISAARIALDEALSRVAEVTTDHAFRAMVAVTELLTNAMWHGGVADITVEAGVGGGWLELVVRQQGDGDDIPPVSEWVLPDDPFVLHGRGLAIVAEVADRVSVDSRTGCAQVSAAIRLDPHEGDDDADHSVALTPRVDSTRPTGQG